MIDGMLKSKALLWYGRVPVIKESIKNFADNEGTQKRAINHLK
jgi:hypothetical protein